MIVCFALEMITLMFPFERYYGQAEQSLILKPGDFLVVFPGDAHRLKIAVGGAGPVSKVVFKVLFKGESE